ncbi:MAG: 2-C-methyl-D-erythritol 4-phosphate cytidylyltransferase [Ruminococcaceae bacterium]|jgi:2-C-methyl-D-erythritol 4-phosphate cytidylyltransferase|nr:2-C-methyl-D-erythritol 4-phosphate cytidylyltransferase [Oscillospiraceae bacterium]
MSVFQSIKRVLRKRGETCAAILVAAGSSSRMDGQDKLLAELGGMTVLERSALAFEQNDRISELVVVTRADRLDEISKLLDARGLSKLTMVAAGGETRADSVRAGLEHISKKAALVAIHDAARPLVSQRIINETVAMAIKTRASAPAIPVKDTIKVAKSGAVVSTPDRKTLYAVQTPQVFDSDLLRAAHKKAEKSEKELTDDCLAAEQLGLKVFLTQGEETNLKITTPLDLRIAAMILEETP